MEQKNWQLMIKFWKFDSHSCS